MKGKSFKSLKIYLADFVDNLNFKHFLFYSDMETSADNITSFDKFNLIFSNKKFRVERNKVKYVTKGSGVKIELIFYTSVE